eukprot:7030069-Heterocapsa_arctica.AAC.1
MEVEEKAPDEGFVNVGFVPNTTTMNRIVLPKEVPKHRSCVAGQDFGVPAGMERMCKDKNCFTCMAYRTTQTFKGQGFDPHTSSIVKTWVELKASQ